MSFLAMLLVTCLVSVFCHVESSEGVYVCERCLLYIQLILFSCEKYRYWWRKRSSPFEDGFPSRKYSDANAFRCLVTTLSIVHQKNTLLGFNADFSKLPIPGCPASDEKSDVMIASRSRSVISRSKERRRLLMRKIWCQVEMWHALNVFFFFNQSCL